MIDYAEYDICGTPLRIFDSVNGIVVSGGADSSILLYLLLKYSKKPLHIFTLCNDRKGTYTPKQSIDVVSKCAELTQNYNFKHHISYTVVQTRNALFAPALEYITDGYVYTGITSNPPKDITDNFLEVTPDIDRDPSTIRSPFEYDKIYTPWTNLNKKQICNIYKHYNLLDSLFTLTRSCEALKETVTQMHCGKCWWCEERKWGFGLE